MRTLLLPVFMLTLVLSLAGCGSGKPGDNSQPVQGKLTNNGAALQIENKAPGVAWVEVRFYPENNGQISETHFQAGVKDDGTFNVPGPSGKGLPPGKYRVIVRQWDPYPQTDKLGGKFDETNSKISYDITGSTTLDIDLAKLKP
jgi:hypothetical protein